MEVELNDDQRLVHDLMLLSHNILQYSKECFADLNDKISPLIDQDFVIQLPPTLMFSLEEKMSLLRKYIHEMPRLIEFSELKLFYSKIFDFVLPDYNTLTLIFSDLRSRSDKLVSLIIDFLIPEKLLSYLDFLKDKDWLYNTDVLAKLDTLRDHLDEVPCWSSNYQILLTSVSNYKVIYKSTRSELFYISLAKELTYKPDINLNFEFNYKNSILQSIIDSESDQSPQSFDDYQCMVLDLLELLTFHIDSIPNIINLINSFHRIIVQKLKYSTKLNLTKFEYNVNIDSLNHLLNNVVYPYFKELIVAGTVGLSMDSRYHDIFKILNQFVNCIDGLNLSNVVYVTDINNIYYRDEMYFKEILKNYRISLDNFLKFLTSCNHSIKVIIKDEKEKFEELDGLIKDCFFDLNYFSQRFDSESKLIAELKNTFD